MRREKRVHLDPVDEWLCAVFVVFSAVTWPLVVLKVILVLAGVWRI